MSIASDICENVAEKKRKKEKTLQNSLLHENMKKTGTKSQKQYFQNTGN